MKMMPPDVISHENQLQHLSEPSIFMLDIFRTADHAGQIFIPHRRYHSLLFSKILGFLIRAWETAFYEDVWFSLIMRKQILCPVVSTAIWIKVTKYLLIY